MKTGVKNVYFSTVYSPAAVVQLKGELRPFLIHEIPVIFTTDSIRWP